MTEIIPGLHQIGAHELLEVREASLIIDMGGIFGKIYARSLNRGDIDSFKSVTHAPIVFLEIDEVDNEPFRQFSKKITALRNMAIVGARVIRGGGIVYSRTKQKRINVCVDNDSIGTSLRGCRKDNSGKARDGSK